MVAGWLPRDQCGDAGDDGGEAGWWPEDLHIHYR
jgi:hypothetical protein